MDTIRNEVRTLAFDRMSEHTLDTDALRAAARAATASVQPNQVEPMLRELWRIFEAYQENGRVEFDYNTRVYYGRL